MSVKSKPGTAATAVGSKISRRSAHAAMLADADRHGTVPARRGAGARAAPWSIVGVEGLPEIEPGDDLAALIAGARRHRRRRRRRRHVEDRVEGRGSRRRAGRRRAVGVRHRVGARAGTRTRGSSRWCCASRVRIVRLIGPVLITETRHGFVCANSGVDQSSSGADGPRARCCRSTPTRRPAASAPGFVALGRRRRRDRQRHVRPAVAGGPDRRRHRRSPASPRCTATSASTIRTATSSGSRRSASPTSWPAAAELVKGNTSRVPVAVVRGYAWERDDDGDDAPGHPRRRAATCSADRGSTVRRAGRGGRSR